jgi:hypothetical protein
MAPYANTQMAGEGEHMLRGSPGRDLRSALDCWRPRKKEDPLQGPPSSSTQTYQ